MILTLHVFLYLRNKFQVSSIILKNFRQREGEFTLIPTSKQTSKKPTCIRLNLQAETKRILAKLTINSRYFTYNGVCKWRLLSNITMLKKNIT